MPNASVAAIVIRSHGSQTEVLLTRRNIPPFKDQWCLPGGYIENFEKTEDAVIREVKEETGLDFTPRFFMYCDEIFPDINFHNVVTVFSGSAAGEIKRQESEVKEIRWFALSEAKRMDLAFSHKKILNDFIVSVQSK